MKRTDRRSDCPVNYAIEAFGDSWSLLLIRDMVFKNKRTYSEFTDSEERISTNILADRLRTLTLSGIIRKDGTGKNSFYTLTVKGLDLVPVLLEMIAWAGKYDSETGAPTEFLERFENDRKGLLKELQQKLQTSHEIL